MAKKPAIAAKKDPAKAKPQAMDGPKKHLAYITEEEAKILDILLQIKKGAKGPDGKPIPQTYEPGDGHPTEFLTELTGAQINELLAKTDGESNPTEHGVDSYYMEASGSGNVKDSSPSQSGTKSSNSTSTSNAGGEGRSGENGMRGPVGSNAPSKTTSSRTSDTGKTTNTGRPGENGMRDSPGANAPTGRDPNSSYDTDTHDSAVRSMTKQGVTQPSARTPSDSQLSRVTTERPSTLRSPSDSQLSDPANLNPGETSSSLLREARSRANQRAVAPGVALDPSITGRNAPKVKAPGVAPGEKVTDVFSQPVDLDPSIRGRVQKPSPTISGPGKTDRENVTTIEQNGVSPFGENVSFSQGNGLPSASSIPSASELAGLVSTPPRNVTTINRNPNGEMPRTTVDTSSELGRLAVGSQFNTPLADDPGAYNESELANAILGQKPRNIGATDFDTVSRVRSDPTAAMLANDNVRTSIRDQMREAPLGTKVDREAPEAPVSGPNKTDRETVRNFITGKEPSLPFRNGVPDAAKTPTVRNSVPDSSLSNLATQKPDDFMAPPSKQERGLQPQRPVNAPTPVPSSSLRDVVESVRPNERALQPQNPVNAPTPVGGVDGDMPDISFDNNQPDTEPTLFDPQTPQTQNPPGLGAGGTGTPAIPPIEGNTEEPPPEPVPGGTPDSNPEAMAGIMPWDRQAYAEIAAAYQAAGQVYTPQAFIQSFYNVQPFTIEHPSADVPAAPAAAGADPYAGIMPWDRPVYDQMRKSAIAAGQTFTPQQFITQFYAPQAQAAA